MKKIFASKKLVIICSILLVVALGAGIGIPTVLGNVQSDDESTQESEIGIWIKKSNSMTPERKAMLAEKEEYMKNAGSNTGMDADGYYDEREAAAQYAHEADNNGDFGECSHGDIYPRDPDKLQKLQDAIKIVNAKKNTNYTVIEQINMDYDVMADATDLLESDTTLTAEETELLKYYIGEFFVAIRLEDPLKDRIADILGYDLSPMRNRTSSDILAEMEQEKNSNSK